MSAIGVFDSGVGGLTLLRVLRERWPNENYVYLADTARLPYGTKSIATIAEYTAQNISYLQQFDLKAVVVACNSASTALLEHDIPAKIPVFNVIGPGARRAVEVSRGKTIGVLGTRATVLGGAYVRAIQALAPDAEVHQQPCPLFVPLVEEGWIEDPITNLIVYRYVDGLRASRCDTLILGCTHYPVLRAAVQRAAGPDVELVDSGPGLIDDLGPLLQSSDSRSSGTLKILCTDFSPRLEETIRVLLGPEHPIDAIEVVDVRLR